MKVTEFLSGVITSEISTLRGRKHLLFVNKKKQKNFVNQGWGIHAGLRHMSCLDRSKAVCSEPNDQKFFASFFQKRCFLPFLQPIDFRQQFPGCHQIGRREAFGESHVNATQQIACLCRTAVTAPESCQTGRSAQFPRQRTLAAG